MSDLISKEKAYKVLTEYYHHRTEMQHKALREALDRVPSAESEEFEWCTGCKEYDQEAHCCHRWTKVIRKTVEELKSAEPERKKGMWIRGDAAPHRIYCSNCYATYIPNDMWLSWTTDGKDYPRLPRNFCPNCGADMRGEDDG